MKIHKFTTSYLLVLTISFEFEGFASAILVFIVKSFAFNAM